MNDKLNQVLQKQQAQISEPDIKEEDIIQLVGFVVGDEEYAIPILNIQEIIKPIEYTRVPSVPDYVLGVFNMRGNVIPLIDLAQRFNQGSSKMTPQTRYIVLKGIASGNQSPVGNAGFVIDRLTYYSENLSLFFEKKPSFTKSCIILSNSTTSTGSLFDSFSNLFNLSNRSNPEIS